MISNFWKAFKEWATTDPEAEEISALYKMKWVMQHPDYELSDDGEVIKKSTGDTDMHNKVTECSNTDEFEVGSIVKVGMKDEAEYRYIGIITYTFPYISAGTRDSGTIANQVGITNLDNGSCIVYPFANSASELIEGMRKDGRTVELANKPITIN